MPWKPKTACRICRRLGCTDASHAPKKQPSGWKATGRGSRAPSWSERQRRGEVVAEWRAEYGEWCPRCGDADYHEDGSRVGLTADHVVPVALGGSEDGELGVLCRRCQNQQATRVAHMKRRRNRE